MTIGAWVGVAVGVVAIVTATWRGGKAVYKLASLLEHLRDDVAELKHEFRNGIRTDIEEAKNRAVEAARLAGQTAQRVSLVEQSRDDAHTDLRRAMNALRSEVDVYTNVVLTDRQRIWARLREAGIDLTDDDGANDET